MVLEYKLGRTNQVADALSRKAELAAFKCEEKKPTINFPLLMSHDSASLETKEKDRGTKKGQKSDNYKISPSRIRTYDQSVNSQPLYH